MINCSNSSLFVSIILQNSAISSGFRVWAIRFEKTDDRVQRSAYLVTHVGEERRFETVRFLGPVAQNDQLVRHVFRSVISRRSPVILVIRPFGSRSKATP